MKRSTFLPLALLLSVSLISTTACTQQDLPPMETSKVTELIKKDMTQGEGAEAKAGQHVTVHYTGWLYDAAAPEQQRQEIRQLTRPP